MSASLPREYDMVRGPLTSCTELYEFKRSRTTLVGWAQVAGSRIILSGAGCVVATLTTRVDIEAWKYGLRLKKEWRLPPKERSQFEFES